MTDSTILIFAGIGSRQTPPDVLQYMKEVAKRLAKRGFLLRSGAADGADAAFELGCDQVNGAKEIWLPWHGFNDHVDTGFYPTREHEAIAASLHPVWGRLGPGPKKLHARNIGQVLGMTLDVPVSFVACWTPDGCESHQTRGRDTGGTGMAISIASTRGIPVFNLFNDGARERLAEFVLSVSQIIRDDSNQ